MGRPRLLVGHLALAHKAVDQYFEIDFKKVEKTQQTEAVLEIDQKIVLEVCRCKFTITKEKEKRKHYITHLEERLIDSVTATEPFSVIM